MKAGSAEDLRRKLGVWGLVAILVMQLLIVGVFFFLALTIVAYVEVVGWFAVVFTPAAALRVLLLLAMLWMAVYVDILSGGVILTNLRSRLRRLTLKISGSYTTV